MQMLTGLKFYRVVVLRELHIFIVVDVTIATQSLPDLYPAKIKTALYTLFQNGGQ